MLSERKHFLVLCLLLGLVKANMNLEPFIVFFALTHLRQVWYKSSRNSIQRWPASLDQKDAVFLQWTGTGGPIDFKFSSHEISRHTLWLLPPIFSTIHLSKSRGESHWTMPLLKFDFTLSHQPLLQWHNTLQASSRSSWPSQIHCPSSAGLPWVLCRTSVAPCRHPPF